MTRRQAAVDILLAIGLLLALGLLGSLAIVALPLDRLPPLVMIALVQGVIVLAIIAALLAWRQDSWQAIGLKPLEARDFGRGLIALALAILTAITLNGVLLAVAPAALEGHVERLSQVGGVLAGGLPWPFLVSAVLFIGFYEELFARGLLLARCRRLFGGSWVPVLASSALFGLGHLYQGWTGVLQTMVIGIVFARLVVRWESLWPVIIAHAALNGLSLAVLGAVG
jgi:uncharacterized protein